MPTVSWTRLGTRFVNSATATEIEDAEFHGAATAAWREWDESPARIELVAHQRDVVFRVHSEPGGSFVLRLHRPGYHDLDELVSEQLWTAALNAAGVGAPVPVRSLDGRRYVPVRVRTTESPSRGGLRVGGKGRFLSDLVNAATGERLARYFDDLGRIAARIHNQRSAGSCRPAFEGTRSTSTDSSANRPSGAVSGKPRGLRLRTVVCSQRPANN